MPELPDVVVYCESLDRFYTGKRIRRIDLKSPFLVRTIAPDLFEAEGRRVLGFRRLGKRIVWELEDELFLVVHLMIAGRFHRKKPGARPKGKTDLAALHFTEGCEDAPPDGDIVDTLFLTEASPKKRASVHVVLGEPGLDAHQPGGLEVLDATRDQFAAALRKENHTVKRSLTTPRLFSGIGNAYSDEILLAARLSPLKTTKRLTDEEVERLYHAVRQTLTEWTDRFRQQTGDAFPEKVTAFRPEMAVHGKFGKPCPVCATPVERIRYASNETNYCRTCQTGGKLLSDRTLSRYLSREEQLASRNQQPDDA
ncbi:MAG: DNA-formamidopyrimidine glycosylase family protein [Planctomycetota bacterium]